MGRGWTASGRPGGLRARGSRRPTPSCTCRTTPRPTCWTARTWAAHEGGFAAAAAGLGAAPALYHADTVAPEAPRARTVAEEIARVVRGRAANPAWIAGMMRHGYRGAAEIARAAGRRCTPSPRTLPERFDAQFDLLFDGDAGRPAVDAFLRASQPGGARRPWPPRFAEAQARRLVASAAQRRRRDRASAMSRGWCPSLFAPMPTGDGLLVRVKPPGAG